MSTYAARAKADSPASSPSQLERGRQILRQEADALGTLSDKLDAAFPEAVEKLVGCPGSVVVTGIGKAGLVGQKIAASLSSTGTPSHFLHPGEAVHGDLGCVRPGDVVLLLSYSGETEEVVRLLPSLRGTVSATIAITSHHQNTLARHVDLTLAVGRHREAGVLGLAPSSSTTLMMAMGDALALVASECKGFTSRQFAKFHPGGSLGRQLTHVTEIMRPLGDCRVASDSLTVREVFVRVSCPGRRTGAIMLTDAAQRVSGIFTDSDLARLLERSGDERLDRPISEVMTRDFQTVDESCTFPDATRILTEFRISELPVVDPDRRPLGMIDITDVVGAVSPALPRHGGGEPLKILPLTVRRPEDDESTEEPLRAG